MSQRSGRSSKNDGIRNDRHKFGTRQRNKTQKTLTQIGNKENIHSNANLKLEDLDVKEGKNEERSLKLIKSEAELLHHHNNSSTYYRMSSTEARKEEVSKTKVRYESHENRGIPHTSSLKIKLKSSKSLDIPKLKEGISGIMNDIEYGSREVNDLWNQICERD